MTRFARAKGSKASNQKAPEDSTPWEVLKEQIIKSKKETDEAKERKQAEQQRIENYNNFLKEQKVQKRKATWCDFPEAESNNSKVTTIQNNEIVLKKRKKNKQKCLENVSLSKPEVVTNERSEVPDKKNKKKKKNKLQTQSINEENQVVNPTECNTIDISSQQTQNSELQKKKSKKKKLQQSMGNNVEKKENAVLQNSQINPDSIPEGNKNKSNNQKPKKKKNKDQKQIHGKEINDRSFQLIINGKEIELVRFDGFPIMKKDAERLEDLKNNMIKKGIPKSEVQRTMKLERRRAEKALARLKREVCYNCRKGGHNLSDCPDLKSKIPGVDSAEGVCFKCGSTEHRQFECKVQRDKEFRFATCFICKEAGHIARQCPDNPKGLYPNGGCCKICGDVTHLKKDCPATKDTKEETSIKLQTLYGSDNIEDINLKVENTVKDGTLKKPKKIKF